MKKLILMAAALMVAAAAYGQGQFLFNTHDNSATPPNLVTFTYNGAPATGSDLFVQVLAGKDAASLAPVLGTVGTDLPLNRTGAGAGYTNPFSDIYTVPGMAGGSVATVGYRAYKGLSYTSASATSALTLATGTVTLTEPPTPPNEVALGTQSVTIVPEPATLALGLIGLGSLLAIRRRK